ncbi:hypothetical protein SAMN04488550_4325 [Gordonia malaquae]|uniref:Regulatory protein n=1 Tax=Gordonia malaquae NBRC 108250 TaxID=1223542 RepID=M3VEJ5_GORML|nr:DUF5685 family protein [Gordonia malaquae]GAC79314.1 hypothetical protein GM1_008_00760 [Gordonia malaquae NBRC 108250]SEE33784.1 hypothetical protein SAMN04488550_4325 [Gordonia malaquae]
MFGLLTPCGHLLDDELRDEWRAHLCGLCLSLRDGHGQSARLTTNTDTVMLSVLAAAQRVPVADTRTAGRCALRGMRRADVVVAADPGVRLATTASLTLAAAKARDVVAEQQLGLAARSPIRSRAARVASKALRARADRAETALDVDSVLTALDRQAGLEASHADLNALTEPTATACAEVFAASADQAGAPENRDVLSAIGADYGRLAHLLDAVDDRDDDARAGAFNPLISTGTSDEQALQHAGMLADRIAERYEQLALHDDRLLRILLVKGVAQAVRRRGHLRAHRHIEILGAGQTTWPPFRPPTWPEGWPYPPPFPPNRRFHQRILPFVGNSFCGAGWFRDHWNHCSDKWVDPSCNDCDDCCDCCDCCDCS